MWLLRSSWEGSFVPPGMGGLRRSSQPRLWIPPRKRWEEGMEVHAPANVMPLHVCWGIHSQRVHTGRWAGSWCSGA
eukprot:4486638-Alexandrium_andersonii.AAC.1